jgi:L-histidine N-alpha-methyltransferase
MTAREAARLVFEETPLASEESFADHVRAGLTARPKRLAPRFLYDRIGSALYEAVTLLPEYYLTQAESEILTRYAGEILDLVGEVQIAELGPGNGRKSRIVLEAALRAYRSVSYRPIDISREALADLSRRLVAEYDRLSVTACYGDYVEILRSRSLRGELPMLLLFLGSSIGNYASDEAAALMRTIAQALRPRDAVLLGTDLKKSKSVLELAYDDPGGVTATFNRNGLARINRDLGGTLDLHGFKFVVRYDEARGCIDAFQESLVAQWARIEALDLDVFFDARERVHTESSHKYDPQDVEDLARRCGFTVTGAWTDGERRFLSTLLTVR